MPLWKPGQSGNPAGRPKGSRNKLCQDFCSDLYEDWLAHGKQVFADVRAKSPEVYLKVVASLVPRHFTLESGISEMTDEQLLQRIKELTASLAGEFGSIEGADAAFAGMPETGSKH